VCSNFFLDFDGWSHISALEQNFNPSASDVKRKQKRGNSNFVNPFIFLATFITPPPSSSSTFLPLPFLPSLKLCFFLFAGYPQALSGSLKTLKEIPKLQKESYFPENITDEPWTDSKILKRYNLTFPYYPFRTLAPRDMHLNRQSSTAFEPHAPLFPAHTQIDLTFKRRHKLDLIDFMLPLNLTPTKGSETGTLTETERNEALAYGGPGSNPATKHSVVSVTVALHDVYLLVSSCSSSSNNTHNSFYAFTIDFFFFCCTCVFSTPIPLPPSRTPSKTGSLP
jgi:hypothetical protein